MRRILKPIGYGLNSLLRTVLGLVAGFSLYAAAVSLVGDRTILGWVLAFLLAPLFGFVSTLIHEAGHAIAAWRCDWIVGRIVVWPFSYVPARKQWSWAPGIASRGDILGWVETRPKGSGGSRRQESWILMGGVIANVLSAALCLLLAKIVPPSAVATFLTAFAAFSIVVAITNVLPWKLAGHSSDGMQLWRLWRRPQRRRSAKGSQWNAPRKW